MTEHDRMVDILFKNSGILARALGISSVWIRGKEFHFDPSTDERADLVFQDKWDPYKGLLEAVCFVVELKSDEGDHEILGQLDKAVIALSKIGIATKHWGNVIGISIAKEYTKSGLELLIRAGHRCFIWSESDSGVILRDAVEREARRA